MTFEGALGIVRFLVSHGSTVNEAVSNPAIPIHFYEPITETLGRDAGRTEMYALARPSRCEGAWLDDFDRATWNRWGRLRQTLLQVKSWPASRVRSLDESTDRILRQLGSPNSVSQIIVGHVIGLPKAELSHYTEALAAKAADVGYDSTQVWLASDDLEASSLDARIRILASEARQGGTRRGQQSLLVLHEIESEIHFGVDDAVVQLLRMSPHGAYVAFIQNELSDIRPVVGARQFVLDLSATSPGAPFSP